jgi:hypothetical protein
MGLDIRLPIGLLFFSLGALLAVFGLATLNSDIYKISLDHNINLIWGLVMLVFGVLMTWVGWRKPAVPPERPAGDVPERRGH